MARIVEKAFDATKKIIRTVFVGQPNLFTTSDVNRQIEAFKYQLDQLDDRAGFLSDMEWEYSYNEGAYTFTAPFSYLFVKGCSFAEVLPSPISVESVIDVGVPYYICLVGEKEVVTYSDDFSHEIAGATFEDGTSRAAANQIVYKANTIGVTITTNPSSVTNLIGVLLKIYQVSAIEEPLLFPNTFKKEDSLSIRSKNIVESISPSREPFMAGDTLTAYANKMFGKLLYTYRNGEWQDMDIDDRYVRRDISPAPPFARFSINKGCLSISLRSPKNFGKSILVSPYSTSPNMRQIYFLPLGVFPEDIGFRYSDVDRELSNYYGIKNRSIDGQDRDIYFPVYNLYDFPILYSSTSLPTAFAQGHLGIFLNISEEGPRERFVLGVSRERDGDYRVDSLFEFSDSSNPYEASIKVNQNNFLLPISFLLE